MFTYLEVAFFHLLLGVLYGPIQERVINRLAGFHAHLAHHVLEAFPSEEPHEIIVQGQKKSRTPRVALASRAAPQLVVYAPGLVSLCSYDAEAAQRSNSVRILFPGLVFLDEKSLQLSLIRPAAALSPGPKLGVSPKLDVGASAGHVRGYGNRSLRPCLGYDQSLAGMVFGVEHFVGNTLSGEKGGEKLGFFDRYGSDKDRLAFFVGLGDFFANGLEFFFFVEENQIVFVISHHGTIGGNDNNIQVVYFIKLWRFRICGSCHSGYFRIHSKVILKGDRRQGSVAAGDFYPFLCLDRLV